LAVAPALYGNLGYDPQKSFTPVATISILPMLLVVHPTVPARTVAEFVAYAKANPGKLNYGAGLATPPHLLSTLFKHKAGIDAVYVAYKGSAPAVTDLLAGTTQWTIDGMTILAPLAKDGRLRPLAVASGARWPDLPDLPTLIEQGFPDVSIDARSIFRRSLPLGLDPRVGAGSPKKMRQTKKAPGVLAPAGTPREVVARLNALTNRWCAGAPGILW